MASRSTRPDFNRRELLGLIGMGGAVGLAGCIGDDDDDDEEPDGTPTPSPTPTPPLDPPTEGGRLEFGIERSDISDYDYADSSLADDSTIFNVIYDGLRVQGSDGAFYNWMAEEYGAEEAQDVTGDDYEEYMRDEEIVDIDDFGIPIYDLDWPNAALVHSPDTLEGIADGDIDVGDDGRVLTREEAPDAVEDGIFGVKVTGRLHEGITFHSGEEVTAEHVVAAYDRYVGSTNHGQVFDSFLYAEEEGEYSFALYAQEADAIAEAALPVIIPPLSHAEIPPGEGLDPRDGGTTPVGTGPFKIAQVVEGTQLLLERYDDYWLQDIGLDAKEWWDGPPGWWDDAWGDFPEAPLMDEINVRFIPEGPTRAAALETGQIDLTYELSAEANLGFQDDDDFDLFSETSTGFKFIAMPMLGEDDGVTEGGAFQHQEVRQAFAHLIPRQEIIDFIEQGFGSPATQFLPEPASGLGSHLDYDDLANADWAWPADPDVEAATQFIEDSPLDAPIEMTVHTNADDEERQSKMGILVDELNDSGLFEAELETPADIGEWTATMLYTSEADVDYAENNQVACIGLASGFDPHGYVEAIHHSDNYNGCCNFFHRPGMLDFVEDGSLDAARFSTQAAEDPDHRRDLYDDLQPRLVETSANTLVDFSDEISVAGPRLSGYSGYPDRRMFLSYGLYAPYEGVAAWLDDE